MRRKIEQAVAIDRRCCVDAASRYDATNAQEGDENCGILTLISALLRATGKQSMLDAGVRTHLVVMSVESDTVLSRLRPLHTTGGKPFCTMDVHT